VLAVRATRPGLRKRYGVAVGIELDPEDVGTFLFPASLEDDRKPMDYDIEETADA